jgi:hypothetical protein
MSRAYNTNLLLQVADDLPDCGLFSYGNFTVVCSFFHPIMMI